MTLDESANGTTIDLALGGEVELVLPENRTTGFRWRLRPPVASSCWVLEDDEFEPPVDSRLGRGGRHRWKLRAERAGACEIRIDYGRSWADGSASRTFVVTVRVR
jgi:predicted secreted protein